MQTEQRNSLRLLQWMMAASLALPMALFVFASAVSWTSTRDTADRQIERTLDVAQCLNPDDLDVINDATYVQRIVDEDGFVSEDAGWVPEYMKGQPKGFFLCHLALTHKFVDQGEANAIRGLMGHPGR